MYNDPLGCFSFSFYLYDTSLLIYLIHIQEIIYVLISTFVHFKVTLKITNCMITLLSWYHSFNSFLFSVSILLSLILLHSLSLSLSLSLSHPHPLSICLFLSFSISYISIYRHLSPPTYVFSSLFMSPLFSSLPLFPSSLLDIFFSLYRHSLPYLIKHVLLILMTISWSFYVVTFILFLIL